MWIFHIQHLLFHLLLGAFCDIDATVVNSNRYESEILMPDEYLLQMKFKKALTRLNMLRIMAKLLCKNL